MTHFDSPVCFSLDELGIDVIVRIMHFVHLETFLERERAAWREGRGIKGCCPSSCRKECAGAAELMSAAGCVLPVMPGVCVPSEMKPPKIKPSPGRHDVDPFLTFLFLSDPSPIIGNACQ